MNDITFASAISIAAAIRRKEVSSREVVDAHLKQIERENSRLNAVVRVLADSARAAAAEADRALAAGKATGVFHGVPMTVKDAWELAGVPSTGGTLGRTNFIPQRDATVIARMRAAGAIPIGMTNLPEMSLAFESDNLVHGRSNNPYNVARTPGGSGGGGAAAIAAGMSPIEIGADLGGSIRLPSHFCGIAGIRVTTGRAPMTGYFPPSIGWTSLYSAAGPMARTVADLAAALPVISGPDWIDPAIIEVPLRDARDAVLKGLRVAVHTDNGIMSPTPETKAAVESAAKALSDAGAIVEQARPSGIEQCMEIFLSIANADAGENIKSALAAVGTKQIHPLLTPLLSPTLEHRSAGFLHRMLARADMYRSSMLSFLSNYDLVLCPVNALPAIQHGDYLKEEVLPAFSYTIAYNLSGWPGAVVRCGTSPEGLPIGVQSVARPWREDVALAAAQHLEIALGGYKRPPLAASAA
ncbi:MAG TPA: amidase [Bryobacteraceae bacterium]|nr:amidase [Bryobacteraceae bacterium]